MHIVNLEEKQWVQQRIESNDGYPTFESEVKRHLLERLTAAEGLEKHLTKQDLADVIRFVKSIKP